MSSLPPRLLCHYGYDPLDRLISHAQSDRTGLERFYCKSRLATEIQGTMQHSVFQHDDQLLGQQRCEDKVIDSALLATDQQRSVLNTLNGSPVPQAIVYSPYGHRPGESGLTSLLGFNGERPDAVTGHYHLGNGYRQYNPVLMRFNSPDSWSPFGAGGLNAYTYCEGDPANRSDESGHVNITKAMNAFLKRVATGRVGKTKAITAPLSTGDNALAGTSAASKPANRKRFRQGQSAAVQRKKRAVVNTLTDNESARGRQNRYSVNNFLRRLSLTDKVKAYNHAKAGYKFETYPDVDRPFYMRDPNGGINIPGYGATVLDVTHWNVAINYFSTKGTGEYQRYKVMNLIIKRAEYIRRYAGIDLMSIQQ